MLESSMIISVLSIMSFGDLLFHNNSISMHYAETAILECAMQDFFDMMTFASMLFNKEKN